MIDLLDMNGNKITLFINWISCLVEEGPDRTKIYMQDGSRFTVKKSRYELRVLIEFELGIEEE
jgi:uncharacterized protein YlzI (FlbEa/FlbD family)